MGAALAPLLFPHPDRHASARALQDHSGFAWITTRKHGSVPAIFVDALTPNVLLYTHGNAEDIGQLTYYCEAMASQVGISVLAVEYPGYSISDWTKASENGCYDAVESAYRYLVQEKSFAPSNVVPFGRSLGSGPAVYIASQKSDIRALILQSPLESGARAVMNKAVGFVGIAIDPFKNYMRIKKVAATTSIIHGTADKVVPCSNGRALHAALHKRGRAAEPLWLEGRGHNDIPPHQVFSHIRTFLTTISFPSENPSSGQ